MSGPERPPERTLMFQLPSMLAGTLACVGGTMAERSWELSAGTFVIGRNEGSDLPLTAEPGVSKVHCKIIAEGEHYLLVDCESRNGTIVNGSPIQRVLLRDGDEIRICGCVLRFSQIGGGTQTRVRGADVPPESVGAAALPPAAIAHTSEPAEPSMLLPSDAASVVEPSGPPATAAPLAPLASRGRALLVWYAGGLAGSLLFGGTASAVIFTGAAPPGQVALDDSKPAHHPAADQHADHQARNLATAPASGQPANADAQPAVPALDPATVKSVANADKPPGAKPGEDKPGDQPGEDKPADPPKAAAATTSGQPLARDEERPRRRPRRDDRAAEPDADADGTSVKAFAASVEDGKSETLKTRGGKVKSVGATDGDNVTRGQVLVTFDASGNEDELATLKERIGSLEGIDDDDARRQLKEAHQHYDALQSASKSVPVIAGVGGKLSRFSVAVGDLLKANQVVGHIAEGGPSNKVRVTVDRATKVKRGAKAILGLRGGGEGEGTVSSTSGRTVVVDTGDHAAEDVENVRF